ncbi:hypothetical protein KUCAC02_037193 [Chaenocephalus aceratus]|nr:hypothetical protein KUCAC02_037193 [Chaenocephalus aceratus]
MRRLVHFTERMMGGSTNTHTHTLTHPYTHTCLYSSCVTSQGS